ncbi:hypothetical protein [Sneathia sanguinegens]|uniref:hypothetical protein n=1 Tax=Sneathia sanguinegens TaxID=40543 RepID=UPI00290F51B2|nr:hypothetical protein [Sneathia sanguinegens]MDU7496581.1 hypothetical protein [Sneathia sanguinegens]
MKIIIFHNKGIILLEYLIVVSLFYIFLGITILFNKQNIKIRNEINKDIASYEINKILDKISDKLIFSNKLKYSKNKIETDEFIITFDKHRASVYSNKNIQADILFNYDEYQIEKKEDRFIFKFKIKDKLIYKVMSLK